MFEKVKMCIRDSPKIVQFWWAVDHAVMDAVTRKTTTKTHGIIFSARNGMLFITLPSGRSLAYVKPKIGENRFGGDCITYEGVGGTKKWERIDSYGPKFVENIVQATSRDILCYAMQTLRCCSIVMHIHDEVVIEADRRMSLQAAVSYTHLPVYLTYSDTCLRSVRLQSGASRLLKFWFLISLFATATYISLKVLSSPNTRSSIMLTRP